MDCISDNELVELLEDRLAPERRAQILDELERCDHCRALARDWAMTSVFGQGQVSRPPTDVPTIVGAYRVGPLIGAGAMGLVFRAHDPELHRDVALKLVVAGDEQARSRALDEGRLLATVRHRNVIGVHAAGSGEGLAYVAMELAAGTSLDHVIANGPIPWRTAVQWFRGAASGLAAAHAAGVIHRDLKPSNLLLDGDDLRLADFGLASTSGLKPAGTLVYVAPEVAAGGVATPASDQFSFCVTLFEAVAGKRPFPGHEVGELRAAWQRGVTSWPAIPGRLRRVIERGLSLDPAARWPDMQALERALAATTRRARWPLIVAPAVAIVAVGALAVASRGSSTSCDAPDPGWTDRGDPRVDEQLGAYRSRWRDTYARTCESPRSPQQRACLDRSRMHLDAILATPTDPKHARVERLQAIASAPGPERCLITADPVTPPAPPAVRVAEALLALGRYREANHSLPPAHNDTAELALLRGRIAVRLSDNGTAETALRRAIELAGPTDQQTVLADAQTDLALVVGFNLDRHEAGLAYAESARLTCERIGDSRRRAIVRSIEGMITGARGDRARGAELLTTAIADMEREGASPLELATAELRLGWMLLEGEKVAEARPHYQRALALRKSVLGSEHSAVADVEAELAGLEAEAGHYTEAIANYRAIIDRLTTTYGPDHPSVTSVVAHLGAAQLESGDYPAAQVNYERVLAARRKEYGESNTTVARVYANLGIVYAAQDKNEEAIAAYRNAATIARSLLGGSHPDVALMNGGLAIALRAMGRFTEARETITGVIEIYRALPGYDVALGTALQTLGVIETESNHLVRARAVLEEAYAIQRRALGEDHIDIVRIQTDLANMYEKIGRLEDADKLLARAAELRLKNGWVAWIVAETELQRASIVWRLGDRVRAKEIATHAKTLIGADQAALAGRIDAWLAHPK